MKIRHLVLWKLRSFPDPRQRNEVLELLRSQLEELPGIIPGILQFEVGVSPAVSPASADLSLLSTFESPEALDAYLIHPRHCEVVELLAAHTTAKWISDYPAAETLSPVASVATHAAAGSRLPPGFGAACY